jgi:hypothetical protein
VIEKNKDPSDALDMVKMAGACAARGYFYGDGERIDLILRGADTISVAEKTENVQGVGCYVIEAKSKYGKHKLWIDPEHGYNIARAQVHKSENDLLTRGKYILKRGESVSSTLDEVQFKKINDIWFPMEGIGTNKNNLLDRKNPSETRMTFRHSQVILNPDHEALGSFLPDDVRNGATVVIAGIDNTKYTWQDGKIVDEQGREVDIETLEPQEPVSLLGEPLTSIEKLWNQLSPADVQGKCILVCFWDVNQRPSRNCVLQIKDRAQTLSKKGVHTILVHASLEDKDKLKQWLRKHSVTLPVYRVTGDADQLRYEWNVQSLPWLILTDKQHTVRAEGFAIDELDNRIKALAGD